MVLWEQKILIKGGRNLSEYCYPKTEGRGHTDHQQNIKVPPAYNFQEILAWCQYGCSYHPLGFQLINDELINKKEENTLPTSFHAEWCT